MSRPQKEAHAVRYVMLKSFKLLIVNSLPPPQTWGQIVTRKVVFLIFISKFWRKFLVAAAIITNVAAGVAAMLNCATGEAAFRNVSAGDAVILRPPRS